LEPKKDNPIGRPVMAADLRRKAIENDLHDPNFYNDLGNSYQDQGKLDEAISCYRKALELKPDAAGAYSNLGTAFQNQGRLNEAISCYKKALQLKPDFVTAYFNLGSALQDQGKLDEAISCYQKALRIKPDAGIEVKTCLALPVIPESKQRIEQSRRILMDRIETLKNKDISLVDPVEQVGSTHFMLAYDGLNDREIHKQIASFYIHACPDLAWMPSPIRKRQPKMNKIRVGIISRHLFDHTIGHVNSGIIQHLSREKFYVTLFRFPGKVDDLSKDIDSSADEVVVLPAQLASARKKIASHPIDILFYPDIGMEPLTYFLAYSRLAPIQCVSWGHPVTTGIPNVDYYISSESAEPKDAQDHYSERLVLLKKLAMYCYRPKLGEDVPSRDKFGFSKADKLYVCPQALFKFHPDFDEVLGSILRRDPRGQLIFFQGKDKHWEKLLRERFARVFPETIGRVRFLPRMSKKEYLSFIRLADVVLDTLHFSGGYSSVLSLACGLPIVTWPGSLMRGRLTLALYKQMGVMDCVVDSAQSYVDLAFRLANDRNQRETIKAKIKAKADVLFEDIEAVRELERFFESAVGNGAGAKNLPDT
jgi:protein O-GlcNAc transferase